jgi:hypothetical protein
MGSWWEIKRLLPCRLMVGHEILDLSILVRIQAGQLKYFKPWAKVCSAMKLSSQKTNILYGFFIVFFCLLAYLNSFRNVNFLIDDWDLIVNNERISHPQYLLYEFFPQLDPSGVPQHYYRPLISVVIAMSYWICGLNVGGYHIINWILLCLASLSAYILINKYFQNALLAFLSALFCAIHPFNSYIVNNASAGFCALQLAFLCWSAILFKSYNDQPERKRYLAVSVSLYTLALLFHDNALTFPAFLLMLAFLVIKNNTATRLLMRLAPYFIVSIIFYAIKKNYSATMGNMLNSETITLWQYFASVARLMAWYFEKLVTGKEVVFIWATHTVVKNVLWWNLGLLSAMLLCLRVYFSEKIDSVIRFAAGSFLLSILAVGVACRFEPVHGWITEPSWLSFAAISFFALLSLCFLKFATFCRNLFLHPPWPFMSGHCFLIVGH